MARHFKEQDIAEFRDCFSLYARNGYIDNIGTLAVIMRSLRASPTPPELKQYMKTRNEKISFADFLEIMHTHSTKENTAKELQAAFKAADVSGRGTISSKELRHILSDWGERLSNREVDKIFQEANIKPNAPIRYDDFIKFITSPLPDY